MRDLLLLFLRFGGFLLFVVLEVLSFFLIVQYNQDQRAIFDNSWANFTAGTDRMISQAENYASLGKTNDSLAVEKARLMKEVAYYKAVLERLRQDTLRAPLLDSLEIDTVFRFLPAAVISNSVHDHHNYIVLDKGSLDGITPNMGVILDNGIVGVVRTVGPRHALVMSVLHRQSKFSASIKGTHYFGSLRWEEKDYRKLLLENVPKHANPAIGDTIETSGYSLVFPHGVPIGTIESVDEGDGGSDTYQVQVVLFADLANLEHVFVVKNATLKEQEDLLGQIQDE